jgi:hypothetical protein
MEQLSKSFNDISLLENGLTLLVNKVKTQDREAEHIKN